MSSKKVIHTFCFAGSICHTSAVQWSLDNRIAVATEKGVHILKTHCSPLEPGFPLPLHKQFIPAPKEILNCDVMVDREYLHSFLDKDYLYYLMMDHTLSPFLSSSSSFLGIRIVKWSPDSRVGGRCKLSILSMDHRLTLFGEEDGSWVQLEDLSLKLYNHHKNLWKAATDLAKHGQKAARDAQREYEKMKSRHYRLATVAMEWTDKFSAPCDGGSEVKEWCYLISACKSGDVIFWKMNIPKVGIRSEMELICEWKSGLTNIKALCWQKTTENSGLLLVSSADGRLLLVPVGNFLFPENQNVQLGAPCLLWSEEDELAVNHVAILKQNETDYIIIMTKGNFLVGSEISIADGSLIVKNMQFESGDHQLPVTGFCKIGKKMPERELLLTSRDGRLLKLSIVAGFGVGIQFNQEEISTELDDTRMCPWGVSSSPNGTLFATVRNIACMYDHLVTREPVQLVIYTNYSFEDLACCMSSLASGSPSSDVFVFRSLYDVVDYLDCFRAYLGMGLTVPPSLQTTLMFSEKEMEDHGPHILQLLRFMLKAALINGTLSDEETAAMDAQFMLVEKLIMKIHMLKVIHSQRDLKNLNQLQSTSLLLMCDWLFIHYRITNSITYTALKSICPSNKREMPAREKCTICSELVPFENISFGECKNSHKFARCCQSLLLCSSYQYLKCHGCKTLAYRNGVWYSEVRCIFCDFTME